VALLTPCPVNSGSITMLVPPASGMNVNQRNLLTMTQLTTFVGLAAIMAIQTDAHCRHIRLGKCYRFGDIRMTAFTLELLSKVFLMIEFNRPFVIGDGLRFFLFTVTHTAFLIVIDVIMTLPADVHRGHQAIL
jgi:hypothetical protein